MRLEFDEPRAREVFRILQCLWQSGKGVFRDIVLPQDRVTLPSDPIKAANFLTFVAITQRGGIVSEDPFKYLIALMDRYPGLFDPFEVADVWNPAAIEAALKEVIVDRVRKNGKDNGASPAQLVLFHDQVPVQQEREAERRILYKIDEFADSWRRNGVTLARRWSGNALAMYEGVSNFEEFFARVNYRSKENKFGLHGMRRKILALLTIWLQEKNLIPVFPTPIPVDFHAMRLLFGTGVVRAVDVKPFVVKPGKHPPEFAGRRFVRVTERLMDQIALWSLGFLPQNGFSHLAINPALWVFSRELCSHEFQNQSIRRKARMRLVFSEALRAYPERWPYPYSDPSCHCPLQHVCSRTVPWGPYYDWGLLILDERVPYPHEPLFDVRLTTGHRRRNNRA